MARHFALPPAAVSAVWFAALFPLCFAAAWLTHSLTVVTGSAMSLWLPTGLLLVAALVSPLSRWPFLALAAAAAEAVGNVLFYKHGWGPAALFISGNVLSGLVGAAILRRTVGDRAVLASLPNAAIFVTVAALVMPTISATIISVALGWSYGQPWYAAIARIFLGDAAGTVTAAPLLLLVLGRSAPPQQWRAARAAEAAALTLFLGVTAAILLGGYYPFLFPILVPLLWAALRFQVTGAILASATIAIFAAILTALDFGSFIPLGASPLRGPEPLQFFILVTATTTILMGAMAEQFRAAFRELKRRNRDLTARDVARESLLAESELRRREAAVLLAAIGEACPDLIFAKNREGHLIYANGATLDVLGVDRGAAESPFDPTTVMSESEISLIRMNDEHVFSTGETLFAEEAVTTPQGHRVFRAAKAPIRNAAGEITGLAGVCVDITETKKAAARERVLMHEIEHRSRNFLAVLQSIVQLIEAETVPELRNAITRRLQALARSNNLIAAGSWSGASLRAVITDEIAPYLDIDDPRLTLAGPEIMLEATLAQAMELMIHELATNAAKYGALSVPTGKLGVHWSVQPAASGNGEVVIVWEETGGPPVAQPRSSGFGSTVINLFGHERDGARVDFDWRQEGLRVVIVQPLAQDDTRSARGTLLLSETASLNANRA